MDIGALLVKLVVIMAGINALTWIIVFYRKLFKNPALMLQNPYYQEKGQTKLLSFCTSLSWRLSCSSIPSVSVVTPPTPHCSD